MLYIRNTTLSDIDRVSTIYDIARGFMRKNGNMVQWINGYPSNELIREDILSKNSYVVTDKDGRICGVFYFVIGEDSTYSYIENGNWLNFENYGVIHRIASDGTCRGVLKSAVDFAFGKIKNIRIDTHADNTVMQNALDKLGFIRCGTIYISDGTPRIAYQKTLDSDIR